MNFSNILRAILLTASVAVSCTKEGPVVAPLIQANVSPTSGNTTQTFSFDLSKSQSRTGRGSKVFTRWDWDGDGKWDTPFTRLLLYEHRYYAPGTWKPRLEMTNMDGGIDTMSFTIPVVRGYSAPRPILTVSPADGHIFTQFLLDASLTHDDEDSLNQLTFRWDFEGDGQWDTPFGDSVKIFHQYPETGVYTPGLQVRDPSGLTGSGTSQVEVTLEDPRLFASFRCIPDSVTDNTPIIMDASASSDLDFPGKSLIYRWDWNDDQNWDTEWLSDPRTEHVFKEESYHFVRLQIKSFRGLTNEIAMKIMAHHRNHAPIAAFYASTVGGNVNTLFRFDCWLTRDFESSPSDMLYRWDFDGDGSWDTDFLDSLVTVHQYPIPGTYKTTLQVKDPNGNTGTCTKTIYVSHGTNQTGIFYDKRGSEPTFEYYGTVLIGDQWWFTRNLSIHDTAQCLQYYYNSIYETYHDYGNFYEFDYLPKVCPPGWRVPSKKDWEKLIANYPEDQLYEALIPGGVSDFAAGFSGSGYIVYKNRSVIITTWADIDDYGYYWSTTKPMDPTSKSVWILEFDKSNRKALHGNRDDVRKLYSVRCVKDR
jgi:uncharacterized protein (TIGR02145 family)